MGEDSRSAPHSRLFVISPKSLNEDQFRKAFEPFGRVDDVYIVKDKLTGNPKGVTYIKFSKTSEAAKALEALNGQTVGTGRPLKVMIASKPEEGSKEVNFEEISHRLFVVVPKQMTEDELFEAFRKYGHIDYARILQDRGTRESKGVGYVKFSKFSEAANAFENCDKSFRAVFARPKKATEDKDVSKDKMPSPEFSYRRSSKRRFSETVDEFPAPDDVRDAGFSKLIAIVNPMLNQDQLWKLFDIVPSMDYCDLQYEGDRAHVEVVYKNPRWAAYAKQKFHGLEFPPGHRLIIRTEFDTKQNSRSASVDHDEHDKILKLAETLVKATSQIQKSVRATDNTELLQILGNSPGTSSFTAPRRPPPPVSEEFNSPNLPRSKPIVRNSEMRARCFIVCHPKPLPQPVLKDLFCRFDNLIDVFMLKGKNFGYAMYSSEQSANNAIRKLHGFECNGITLKVVEAEERPEHKRQKVELDY